MPTTRTITEGSIVRWSLRGGLWRVAAIVPTQRSESPEVEHEAALNPLGDRWDGKPRRARLQDLTLDEPVQQPVDLEDFPCSPA